MNFLQVPTEKSEDFSALPSLHSLDHCQVVALQNVYKNSEPPRNLFSLAWSEV